MIHACRHAENSEWKFCSWRIAPNGGQLGAEGIRMAQILLTLMRMLNYASLFSCSHGNHIKEEK
jgi:hypothetical protein